MTYQNPNVKLYYGPYESHGVIKYKTQRLHGIIECLSKMGYNIELAKSPHIERLTVEMMNRIVFRCNIKNLCFNMNCENDIVCERLIAAVEEAKTRMYSENNEPLYDCVEKDKREIHKLKHTTQNQDYLTSNVKLLFDVYDCHKSDEYYQEILSIEINKKGLQYNSLEE